MRREAAILLSLVALVAAGCGGDDETAETVPPAPELSLPGEETPTLDDLPESTTGTDGDSGATPDAGTPGEAAPPPSGDQGGGQQAPEQPSGGQPAPEDTPENDTPPPPGSPAEQFEQFCAENPTAC